jgi:hypothetical protein
MSKRDNKKDRSCFDHMSKREHRRMEKAVAKAVLVLDKGLGKVRTSDTATGCLCPVCRVKVFGDALAFASMKMRVAPGALGDAVVKGIARHYGHPSAIKEVVEALRQAFGGAIVLEEEGVLEGKPADKLH